jgi:phosphoribosylanthranilate isomerase
MFIKICANTNLADARLAVELGADAVGFVFAPSKRQVTLEQVADITSALPAGVEKVGIFVAHDSSEVKQYVAGAGLTAAQLHGAFDRKMVQSLSAEFGDALKIIQTVAYELNPVDRAASEECFEATLRAVFAEPAVWAVLLDAAKSGASGGLGVTFDWEHVAEILRRAYPSAGERPRVILAGGLRPENVAQAVTALQPWGVDVVSGVEAAPGKKDPEKVRAFLAAARAVTAP